MTEVSLLGVRNGRVVSVASVSSRVHSIDIVLIAEYRAFNATTAIERGRRLRHGEWWFAMRTFTSHVCSVIHVCM